MSRGKFGGDQYTPKNLGPEPADAPPPISAAAPSTAQTAPAKVDEMERPVPEEPLNVATAAVLAELRRMKVPFSSRITAAADQQLKTMAREGRSQTDLLAEALNLLFKKHGKPQVA